MRIRLSTTAKLLLLFSVLILTALGVAAGLFLAFFARPVSVVTGPALEQVSTVYAGFTGEILSGADGTAFGTARAGGNFFAVIDVQDDRPVERASFPVEDLNMVAQYVVSVTACAGADGYFLASLEDTDDHLPPIDPQDGTVAYDLYFADAASGWALLFDELDALAAPHLLAGPDGRLLVSWRDGEGCHLSAYDPAARQLLSCRDTEVYLDCSAPLDGEGYLCGALRPQGDELRQGLAWCDGAGNLLAWHDCQRRGAVEQVCTDGDKVYALVSGGPGAGAQLLVADLDRQAHAFSRVRFYALPAFSDDLRYAALRWDEQRGLRVLFCDPGVGLAGAGVLAEEDGLEMTARFCNLPAENSLQPGAILPTAGGDAFLYLDEERALFLCR